MKRVLRKFNAKGFPCASRDYFGPQEMGKRRLNPFSVARIQDILKDPNCTITNIANAATVSRKMVTKIKPQHAAQISGPFFRERLDQTAAQELVKKCRVRTILLQTPPRFKTTHPSR
jgi:hypothetical protein